MCSSDCYLIRSIVDDISVSSKYIRLCCLLRNGKLGECDVGTLDSGDTGAIRLRICILGRGDISPISEIGYRKPLGEQRLPHWSFWEMNTSTGYEPKAQGALNSTSSGNTEAMSPRSGAVATSSAMNVDGAALIIGTRYSSKVPT